jgi:hypothetical protein
MPRLGTGENAPLFTADAPRAASCLRAAPQLLAASSPGMTRGLWGEGFPGSAKRYPTPRSALDQKFFRPGGSGGWKRSLKRVAQNPVIKRARCCRPLCSLSYSRHGEKVLGGSPNGPAFRPILGRAHGVTPPCALGSLESRQRHEVAPVHGAAPPCALGSSENRQRRGVGSRFLRFLWILMRSPTAAIGAIRLGSLFLTLPTRALIGQHIIHHKVACEQCVQVRTSVGSSPSRTGEPSAYA